MTDTPERHFLLEAQMLLRGERWPSGLAPLLELAHLEALDEFYQVHLIQLANDAELLKRKALNT